MESRKRVYIAVRTIVISGTLPRCVGNQETHAARHPTYHLQYTNERLRACIFTKTPPSHVQIRAWVSFLLHAFPY
jgi:hypothetical protein